jgi:hypothetical protein
VLTVEGQHAYKLIGDRRGYNNLSGDELTTAAASEGQKNTAS